ncbi:MAG: esterase family protein [Flavobacteriales bacterium]|nr:esterase family protein [Flavobacteriales bacterium]
MRINPFNWKIELALALALLMSVPLLAGKVVRSEVFSESMKLKSACVVILPDSYDSTHQNYPVLYLLHGYGGNEESWLKLKPGLTNSADLNQLIIVCPDGGYRSWYLDSPIDSTMKYETFLIEELIPWIDKSYRTKPDRNHRAITGLSMGGHGALYLSVRHPELFGAAGSMSGGVDIRQYTASWDLKEKVLGDTICCKQNWEDHTVMNVVENLRNGQIKLMIDCGVDDFFIGVNRNLHEKLLKMGVDHDYIERPGKHDSAYWFDSVDFQMLFFRKFFESSTP